MLTFLNYAAGMWVVFTSCLQPANWEACLPVHEWLWPEIQRGYDIWSGRERIYQSEQDYLGGLDDQQQ